MARGPLGLPRLTNIGPLVEGPPRFGQEVSTSDMLEMVQDIVNENDIDPSDAEPGSDDYETVVNELADELFDSERKKNRFRSCLQGTWSQGWSSGFDSAAFPDIEDIEGEESLPLEQLSTQATGCKSLVESTTLST